MDEQREWPVCIICGELSTQIFGGSEVLPLCALRSCEVALIREINGETVTATSAEWQEGVV